MTRSESDADGLFRPSSSSRAQMGPVRRQFVLALQLLCAACVMCGCVVVASSSPSSSFVGSSLFVSSTGVLLESSLTLQGADVGATLLALQTAVATLSSQVQQQAAEISVLQVNLTDTNVVVASQGEIIVAQELTLQSHNASLVLHQEEIDELKRRVSTLEVNLTTANIVIAQQAVTIAEQAAAITVIQAAQVVDEAAITVLQDRATADEALITALQDRATDDEALIAALQERATDDETLITNLQNRTTDDEALIAANAAAIAALQNRTTDDEALITALQDRATDDEALITVLQNRATDDETLIAANAAAISALQTRATAAEANITALQARATTIESAATALATRVTAAECLTGTTSLVTRIANQTSQIAAIQSVDAVQTNLLSFLTVKPYFFATAVYRGGQVVGANTTSVTMPTSYASSGSAGVFSWGADNTTLTLIGARSTDADAGLVRRFDVAASIQMWKMEYGYFDWWMANTTLFSTIKGMTSDVAAGTIAGVVTVQPNTNLTTALLMAGATGTATTNTHCYFNVALI